MNTMKEKHRMKPMRWNLIPNDIEQVKIYHRLVFHPTINERFVRIVVEDAFVGHREDKTEYFMRTMTSQVFTLDLTLHRDNILWGRYRYAEGNERLSNERAFYPIIHRASATTSPDMNRVRIWIVNSSVRLMQKYFRDCYIDEKHGFDVKARLNELRTFVRGVLDEGGFIHGKENNMHGMQKPD